MEWNMSSSSDSLQIGDDVNSMESDDDEQTVLDQIYLVLTCGILVVGTFGNLMVIGAVMCHR